MKKILLILLALIPCLAFGDKYTGWKKGSWYRVRETVTVETFTTHATFKKGIHIIGVVGNWGHWGIWSHERPYVGVFRYHHTAVDPRDGWPVDYYDYENYYNLEGQEMEDPRFWVRHFVEVREMDGHPADDGGTIQVQQAYGHWPIPFYYGFKHL